MAQDSLTGLATKNYKASKATIMIDGKKLFSFCDDNVFTPENGNAGRTLRINQLRNNSKVIGG